MITSQDVLSAKFSATKFRAGYDIEEVDDLLDRVVRSLDAPPGLELGPLGLRADDVRTNAFTTRKFREGYDPSEVDALLDRVAEALAAREPAPSGVRTYDATVPSIVSVPVRVYVPEPPGARPGVLVWAHGGGFVHGGLDMAESDAVARGVATRAGVVIVAVDYELAGQGRGYPVPHTQVRDVVAWARAQAPAWGADPAAVAAGGASAGACVVLGATLSLLDDGLPLPARLLLAYPAAHRVLRRDPSLAPPATGPDPISRFDDARMAEMFATYANGAASTRYLSVDGRSLVGLPPLLVHAAERDDLRTSAEDLVERARQDGVEAVLHVADATHGYLNQHPPGPAAWTTIDAFARSF